MALSHRIATPLELSCSTRSTNSTRSTRPRLRIAVPTESDPTITNHGAELCGGQDWIDPACSSDGVDDAELGRFGCHPFEDRSTPIRSVRKPG